MLYRRLSSGEAAVIDREKSKPKLVKRYKYDEEYYPEEIWIPPFFFVLGEVSLGLGVYFRKTLSLGIIFGALILIFGFILAMSLLQPLSERSKFIRAMKDGKSSGEQSEGRIRSYILYGEESFSSYKGAWGRKIKIKYSLLVEVGEDRKIVETPKLRLNPNSILKSDICKVYLYKNKKYVMDFDLRTKRDDETADIPRKSIKVEKGYLPPGKGYGTL